MFKHYLTSERGLSSTSANYIANVAKESIEEYEAKLANYPLYSVYFNLLDTPDKKQRIIKGLTNNEFIEIFNILKKIAKTKSLCAWIREAIKTKEKMLKELRSLDAERWAKENNIEWPVMTLNRGCVYDHDETLTIADKAEALIAETFAAVYGKCVHRNGSLNAARKAYYDAIQNPTSLKGEGHGTIVMTNEPTVSQDVLESTFMELQNIWRGYEAQSNKFKYDEEQAIAKYNSDSHKQTRDEFKRFTERLNAIRKNFDVWRQDEETRISALKIVIPEKLQDIFNEIQALGKKSVD